MRSLEELEQGLNNCQDGFELKPLTAGEDDLSSCPCFTIVSVGFVAKGHCWRTSTDGCKHPYSGVHVWTDRKDLAKTLKVLLDRMDWYGKWPLTIKSYSEMSLEKYFQDE